MEPSQVSSPNNLSTPSSPCCSVVVYDIIMTSHVTADRRDWMNTRNWPNNTWTHHLLEDCEMWLKALEEASLDYYFCQTYQFCIFSRSSVLCFQQSASLVPTVSAASRLCDLLFFSQTCSSFLCKKTIENITLSPVTVANKGWLESQEIKCEQFEMKWKSTFWLLVYPEFSEKYWQNIQMSSPESF